MAGVIILIVLGIVLFLIEFLIIPGTTIAGIGGLILLAAGIYLAFENYGYQVGLIILGVTLISSIIILIIALRSRTWKGVMLNTNINGIVNEGPAADLVKPGDKGITVTRLAPIGKIKVNDLIMEGKSIAGYLNPKTEIEIIKITGSQAIVKPV